uniref:Uncharacterized protein n=1 Tax=Meloidogyne enterolobii TaxID=390850 RepID=A0A6V7XCV6_MELEN|nr:unnamed protein product [Meloidogyne enterolobii]
MFTNQQQNIPTTTTTNPKNKKIIKFRKFPFSTTKILRKNLILKERKIKNKNTKNYFLKEERKQILEKLRKMVGEKIGCGQLQIVNSVINYIDLLEKKLQTASSPTKPFPLVHRTY